MAFQSTVNFNQAMGVVGEIFDDGPRRSQPYILNSADASYNVFGRAFSISSEGIAQAGNPGGTSVFAGILVNPKSSPLFGASGSPLSPSLALPNNNPGELLFEGAVVVSLPSSANIGDWVYYDNTTGILGTVAPSGSLPSGKSWAYAVVDRFTVSGAGLAVIRLLDTPGSAY
jgi:hypothetical protein